MATLPLILLMSFLAAQPAPAPQCADWKSCRDLADAAAGRGDHETFHDLAWRTMQLRRANDPDVMYMLARAQSLSGRPHDALVMLGRVIAMGVATDADANPDFARVRALAGWPALQARIEQVRAGGERADTPAPEPTKERSAAAAATAAPPEGASAAAKRDARVQVVATFNAPRFAPGGIAYDAVSRRYLVGNFPERKLTEIEEGSNRPATLAGAAAQFFDVKALEIDTRQGDLWVVSGGTTDGGTPASALHKLQLVSGRVLKVFDPPAADLPVRFVDVAIATGGSVLVLDAAQPRIFTIGRSGGMQVLASLPAGAPASIAPVNNAQAAYVAYRDRLLRVDLQQGSAVPVAAPRPVDVQRLERIRWYRDSLIGVQATEEGRRRLVRLQLDRGRVGRMDVLDEWPDASGGLASASLIGDDFYYLVPGEGESVIRRIRLR